MPTLGFLKKKKKEKDSLHARQNSSNSAEIRNHSEPPTPTTSTSAATSHSHQPSSSTTHSAVSTAPSTKPATPAVSEPMALVSERPMIPEQQQQQSYQPPGPSNHQQHQSDINNLINPPTPTEYGRSFEPIPGNGPQPHHSHGTPTQAKPEPQHQQVRSTKGKYTLSDFILQRTLGTGSFGRVHLVQSRHNMRFYAIKVLKKAQVVKMKQVEHTNDERKMLQKVKHPFLITLWGTFQDNKNLYMVMDFIEGGELFSLLRKSQRFPNPVAKFYAAEVALALEYLHSHNIIYRDLKPENLLLDRHGHLKITDFGFAKEVEDITWTLCGTPDYLAPEVVSSKGYNKNPSTGGRWAY